MVAFTDPFEPRFYQGHVMHMRLRPRAHQFRYRVFTSYLDIDRLEETAAGPRLFSVDRFNLLSFHRADHGPRDGSDLRPWVEALCTRAGRPKPERIMLLSVPRVLGYAFNPLSVYFCHGPDGRLETIIYQVKNTFGDQQPYVLPVEAGPDGAIRHEQQKGMFVSPFIPMEQTYRFTLRPPGERLAMRIRQGDRAGELLIATQNGVALPLADASILRLVVRDPVMTRKVIGGIHWEALRLFLKGAPFRRYPGEERAKLVAENGQMPLENAKSA
jgi:DUF1365 family protein